MPRSSRLSRETLWGVLYFQYLAHLGEGTIRKLLNGEFSLNQFKSDRCRNFIWFLETVLRQPEDDIARSFNANTASQQAESVARPIIELIQSRVNVSQHRASLNSRTHFGGNGFVYFLTMANIREETERDGVPPLGVVGYFSIEDTHPGRVDNGYAFYYFGPDVPYELNGKWKSHGPVYEASDTNLMLRFSLHREGRQTIDDTSETVEGFLELARRAKPKKGFAYPEASFAFRGHLTDLAPGNQAVSGDIYAEMFDASAVDPADVLGEIYAALADHRI